MRSDKVDEHLSPICDTAFLVAGMRHIDYTTARVGDDKYAGLLAGEQGIEYASKCLATSPLNKVLSFAGNRTRYIDMNTKKYCEENDIKQILILAAGLDSRPYRLEIDTHPTFFEVDAEPVIDYKTKKMAEHSIKPIDKLVSIVHDLRDPGLREKLIAGGFNTELKAFVIIEGLFEYLPLTACVNILKLVNGMVPSGSYVMCSTPSEDLTKSKAELFKSMIDVIVENNAHPCLGTSDVEGDILKPAGFELIKLYHTLQPDYFHKPDLSDPLVIKYNEVEVKKFVETGEGPRQQFYVGRKL